jgi:hypothetical protein
MKNVITNIVGRAAYFALGVAAASVFFMQDAHAGLFDSAMTSDWKTKETTKYKLDMYGFDARAYEFETDNGMKCVIVFPGGDAKGSAMQCVSK